MTSIEKQRYPSGEYLKRLSHITALKHRTIEEYIDRVDLTESRLTYVINLVDRFLKAKMPIECHEYMQDGDMVDDKILQGISEFSEMNYVFNKMTRIDRICKNQPSQPDIIPVGGRENAFWDSNLRPLFEHGQDELYEAYLRGQASARRKILQTLVPHDLYFTEEEGSQLETQSFPTRLEGVTILFSPSQTGNLRYCVMVAPL